VRRPIILRCFHASVSASRKQALPRHARDGSGPRTGASLLFPPAYVRSETSLTLSWPSDTSPTAPFVLLSVWLMVVSSQSFDPTDRHLAARGATVTPHSANPHALCLSFFPMIPRWKEFSEIQTRPRSARRPKQPGVPLNGTAACNTEKKGTNWLD
jgi:hypothetical protein